MLLSAGVVLCAAAFPVARALAQYESYPATGGYPATQPAYSQPLHPATQPTYPATQPTYHSAIQPSYPATTQTYSGAAPPTSANRRTSSPPREAMRDGRGYPDYQYTDYQYPHDRPASPSSAPAFGPPPHYQQTFARRSSPAHGNAQGQERRYNQPYARDYGDDRRYTATESLGPYNDFRQQDEFQPDFRDPPQSPRQARELFEPGKKIAIVEDAWIFAGDLYGDINQMLAPYKDKATPEQLDEQRHLLLRKLLPQMIQTKMLYQEMLASLPEEAIPQVQAKLDNEFDDKQLPALMERAKVDSPAELDAKLREFGTSIEKQRRQFAEQVLARELIRQNVNAKPDVGHDEMLRYYQQHASDYDRPARVRWEELAVQFDKFSSKAEAYRAIANMGNRVLRGAAFSRVAREQSQGFSADNGGWYDWTQRGTLTLKEIEEAIFTLPPDQLSQIIETETGFHIIRVLDREEAGRIPFFQEQMNIKEKLQKEKRDAQVDEFLAKVKERTRVWTIYDDGETDGE